MISVTLLISAIFYTPFQQLVWVCVNATELLKKTNKTLQRHVTTTTSQAPPTRRPVTSQAPAHMTSRGDDVTASIRHQNVPYSYYDDVNIPSDSYFTGDEEIPVWNVPDHVPLMDTDDTDDDDDDDDDDDGEKLFVLGKLLLSQLSRYITAANDSNTDAVGRDRNRVVASQHETLTSSVSTETGGYHDDASEAWPMTSQQQLQGDVPLTTTLSPLSLIISRLFDAPTTTSSQQPGTQTYEFTTSSQGHVTDDDVTTMTSTAVQDVGSYSSSHSDAKTAVQTAAAAPAVPAVSKAGGARRPFGPRRQSGGYGGTDYFDFIDYVVEYQTPRPRRRPPHLKARHPRKKVKLGHVKRGQAKSGHDKLGRSANRIFTWPDEPGSGAVDQLDVVGQSYGVEVTGAGSENFDRPGRPQRRRLPQPVPGRIVRGGPQQRRRNAADRRNFHGTENVQRNMRRRTSGDRFLRRKLAKKQAVDSSAKVEPVYRQAGSTDHRDAAGLERSTHARPRHHYVNHHIIHSQDQQ